MVCPMEKVKAYSLRKYLQSAPAPLLHSLLPLLMVQLQRQLESACLLLWGLPQPQGWLA